MSFELLQNQTLIIFNSCPNIGCLILRITKAQPAKAWSKVRFVRAISAQEHFYILLVFLFFIILEYLDFCLWFYLRERVSESASFSMNSDFFLSDWRVKRDPHKSKGTINFLLRGAMSLKCCFVWSLIRL